MAHTHREMYTTLSKPRPQGAGPFHVGKLVTQLRAVHVAAEEMYLAGIRLTVDEAEAVVSEVPDLDDDYVEGPHLVVRIDEATDDHGTPLHGLIQQIIIDGLRDYAAKQHTGTSLSQ